MSTGSLTAEKADMFEEGNIEAITRMMQNRKKNQLWLAVTRNEKSVSCIGRFPISVVAVFVLSISRMKKWNLGDIYACG